MSLSFTILGCGGSGGVPTIGNYWGDCDPDNPKNMRTRASILVEWEGTRILVDTCPDLRAQCLREGINKVDAIIWTHDHADHTHGIDDLRAMTRQAGGPIPSYTDAETFASMEQRFQYVFQTRTQEKFYRPLTHVTLVDQEATIGDNKVKFFRQVHGSGYSYGLRFGALGYSTDVSHMPEAGFEALEGIDTWILDCLTWRKHPTHASWEVIEPWIDRLKPRQVFLTHLGPDLDYEKLNAATPDHVFPAYDGLSISL